MKRKTRKQASRGTNGSPSIRSNGKRSPRTAEQYFAMSERSQEIWNRVAHVISRIRADGASLQEASREFHIDPRTVVRWGGPALRKTTKGRYTVKASDRLLRVLVVPTPKGLSDIAVRGSREASKLANYWVAVQKYLQTGSASDLQNFEGQFILDGTGQRIDLLTNLDELDRLGNAGVFSFESLYARVA